MNKILIVEDDIKLRSELEHFLTNSGFLVKALALFSNTTEDIINSNVDLVLLDVNLPNLNGEVICREVRKKISLPIIIITSRNTELDELISFNSGADDFITKPFNTQILLARIERLLNRTDSNLKYNDLLLDSSKSIIMKDNKIVDLSKNEFKILYYFIKNKDRIISRDELMDYLWNEEAFVDDNTLTVNINRLRNKLSELGYNDAIVTKRGQGYILVWI